MQALWSRAAQAQSFCRCRLCLHSTNALARRSTTAAARTRRKVTVADLFTACYTTILGTATMLDARRKNMRREHLDQDLDRARASLHQLAGANTPTTSSDHGDDGHPSMRDEKYMTDPHLLTDTQSFIYSSSNKPFTTSRQPLRDITARRLAARPLLDQLQALCGIAYEPIVRPSVSADHYDWRTIEGAVALEEQDPDVILSEPRTDRDLAEATDTVNDLADRLLHLAKKQKHDQPDTPDPAADAVLQKLHDLRNEPDYPGFHFPLESWPYTNRVRAGLNEAISTVFRQSVKSKTALEVEPRVSVREAVARICYNLVAAGVPPSIHTYHTLIIGFNRMRRPDLAEAVIKSFLYETSWPATDQTVVCLLAHYHRPHGREGMRVAVQRIWGARVNGLKLATLDGEKLCEPDSGQIYAVYRGRRAPKIKSNDNTFDHLIKGWLYHGRLDLACMSFVACLRNGSSIPLHTLHEIFRGCLASADFANARKLLNGIANNLANFQAFLSRLMRRHATAAVQEVLRSLRQIMNICWFPFGQIFGDTYHTHQSSITPALRLMFGQLHMLLEWRELAKLPALLSDSLSSDQPLLDRLELAISHIDMIRPPARSLKEYEDAYLKLAMIVSVDTRYHDLEERIRNLTAACNASIINIKTGYNVDVNDHLLSERIQLDTSTAHTNRVALRAALGQLDVCDDSLTLEKVASQLVQGIPDKNLVRDLEQQDNWKRLPLPVLVSFYRPNAASRRIVRVEVKEGDDSFEQLQALIRQARDSFRAFAFTHLTQNTQTRLMSHHRSYYNIPLRTLRFHLYRELKNELPSIIWGWDSREWLSAMANVSNTSIYLGAEQLVTPEHHPSATAEAEGLASSMKVKKASRKEQNGNTALPSQEPRLTQDVALG